MTQTRFSAIPVSTWLQLGTLLVIGGVTYATMVSSTENLSVQQERDRTQIVDNTSRVRVLENQFSRSDERMSGLVQSMAELKAQQAETNAILRNVLENINR